MRLGECECENHYLETRNIQKYNSKMAPKDEQLKECLKYVKTLENHQEEKIRWQRSFMDYTIER